MEDKNYRPERVFILRDDFRSVGAETEQPHVHRQQHESCNNTQKTQEA